MCQLWEASALRTVLKPAAFRLWMVGSQVRWPEHEHGVCRFAAGGSVSLMMGPSGTVDSRKATLHHAFSQPCNCWREV